jgi:ceramide glucosyltransferase
VDDHDMSMWLFTIALAGGVWYFLILIIQAIGFTQLFVKRHP